MGYHLRKCKKYQKKPKKLKKNKELSTTDCEVQKERLHSNGVLLVLAKFSVVFHRVVESKWYGMSS